MIIEVEHFAKTFSNRLFRKPAVAAQDVHFAVERGEVFGFLGPNGAGKSTTIKALLGLIRPTSGQLKLFGKPVSEGEWRNKIGYMPEHPTFYDYLTGFEMVCWFGRLSGLTRHEAEQQANKQLQRVGLEHAIHRRIRTYSKGMLQRAGIAQALINNPELLILDEPMTGLDPIGRKDIRELIKELKNEGKTVFYSTHILPDIEMTCERVSIVDSGVTKTTGKLKDILSKTTRGFTISFDKIDDEALQKIKQSHPNAQSKDGRLDLEIEHLDEATALTRSLITENNAQLLRFEPHQDNLEAIFLRSLDKKLEQQVEA